jgi:hypothetical protein
MSGGSEPKQTYAFASLYARNTQAAEANNPRTEKWRGVQVVKPFGKREDEVFPGQRVLCIPSVYGVAREYRRIAKILHVVMTVPTSSIDTTKPANTNARPQRQGTTSLDNIAHDLVPGN